MLPSGRTVDDVSESSHGTYVAMVAGAAANGWGMVGAWPQLKVLSVRALTGGGEEVPASGATVDEKIAILRTERAGLQARADSEARIGLLPAFRTAGLLLDSLAVRSDSDGDRAFDLTLRLTSDCYRGLRLLQMDDNGSCVAADRRFGTDTVGCTRERHRYVLRR